MHVHVSHFCDESVISIYSHTQNMCHTPLYASVLSGWRATPLAPHHKLDSRGHHGLGPFFSFFSARGAIVRLPKIRRRLDGGARDLYVILFRRSFSSATRGCLSCVRRLRAELLLAPRGDVGLANDECGLSVRCLRAELLLAPRGDAG